MKPITTLEIVDIIEARYAELEKKIEDNPKSWEDVRRRLEARRDELALILGRIFVKEDQSS